jgi:RNA polymerase sigma-70 factor, ECF subfamily
MPLSVSHLPAGDTCCVDRWAIPSTTHSTDEARRCALVEQLAAGDCAALDALYKMTVPLLFSIALKMLSNAADAEEIIFDVYRQVWQTAAQYDAARGSVMSWLVMICRSRAVDRYRQNKCRSHGSDGYDGYEDAVRFPVLSEPDDILQTLQRSTAVRAAIQQLSPLRRRLLALAFFHDLSHQRIAFTANLSLGTVKSHIRRALATLRKELEKSDPA